MLHGTGGPLIHGLALHHQAVPRSLSSSEDVPFLPPASTTMLQMVMRSSMLIASMAVPENSMDLRQAAS